jgi:calcium-dependent protein kinase
LYSELTIPQFIRHN